MNKEQIQTLAEQYAEHVKRHWGEFDMAEAKAAAKADKVVDHVPPFWKSEMKTAEQLKEWDQAQPNFCLSLVTDKKGFAKRWGFSVRTMDNFLAKGLPHLKVGSRRIRIVVTDGDAWMQRQYGTRRNG